MGRVSTTSLPQCWWGHPDCFAHRTYPEKCNALFQTYFPGRSDCPFYKPMEQYEEEKEKYGGPDYR